MNGIGTLSCEGGREVDVLVRAGVASWIVHEVLVHLASDTFAGGVGVVEDL